MALTLLLLRQGIDELKVAVEACDENFVSLRRSLFELQRSLKSSAINNNVLLKHLETCIQSKVSFAINLSTVFLYYLYFYTAWSHKQQARAIS